MPGLNMASDGEGIGLTCLRSGGAENSTRQAGEKSPHDVIECG